MKDNEVTFHREKIGFIPLNGNIIFSKGEILKLDTFEKAKKHMHENSNVDGYYYPPVIARYPLRDPAYQEPDFTSGPVARTKKPAHLFKLPASHEIVLHLPYSDDPRNNECMFLVQFLACIFGIRAHISEWWIDGRVPQKNSNDYIICEKDLANLTDMALDTWSKCETPEQQLHLTNLLYMHNRVFAYEWDWEQFTIAYMVFDGCYRYLQRYMVREKISGHANRLKFVLDELDKTFEDKRIKTSEEDQIKTLKEEQIKTLKEERIKYFVFLRNNLFHETLWDSKQPGTSVSRNAFIASRQMKKICTRVLLYILGYKGNYFAQPWWSAGSGYVLKWPE